MKNELRIGNLVIDKEDGNVYRIPSGLSIERADLMIPIPLTEDWLVGSVFEMYIDDAGSKCFRLSILDDKDTFYLRPSHEGGYYWGFCADNELNNVRPIKFVHKLQNILYELTDKELTI